MVIRKCVPLLAPLLALAGLLTVGGAGPVLADARPSIVSVTLDANNHAVVTWSKESWQGSVDVKWSTGDGAVAAPDANWDSHYGLPLVDCYGQPLSGNPYGGDETKGQWDYGQHCKGQDVADAATTATTWDELIPGVYYFQVEVAGENHETGQPCNYQDKGLPTECLSPHYSGVYRLTVLPEASHSSLASPGMSAQPGSSIQSGPTAPQAMNGPGRFVAVGGGQVDVGAGGQVVSNPPYNFDIRHGMMHLRENLVSFHCPSWTQPYSPGTTLADWIGVRCRTVTTPQAGALVMGTEFSVTVSDSETIFWVFEGQIEVSDLFHRGPVRLGPGQTTTVLTGETPTAPVAFDASDPTLRWWIRGQVTPRSRRSSSSPSACSSSCTSYRPSWSWSADPGAGGWSGWSTSSLPGRSSAGSWPSCSPSPCPAPARPPAGHRRFRRMEPGGGTGMSGDPCLRSKPLRDHQPASREGVGRLLTASPLPGDGAGDQCGVGRTDLVRC